MHCINLRSLHHFPSQEKNFAFHEQVAARRNSKETTMDKVCSIDNQLDPFSSLCPSEWFLEKYLEEMASSIADNSYSRADSDLRVLSSWDLMRSPSCNAAVSSLVSSTADPHECVAFLTKKLYSSCAAAAAKLQGVGTVSQDSSTINSKTYSSSLGSEALVKGAGRAVQAIPLVNNLGCAQGITTASESSREQSDEDEPNGEEENVQNMDPADTKRLKRMLSNRESARRSRRKKQARLSELETEVARLKVENSSLLKRLANINQKYNEASVDNRIMKADLETLRAKVKMAEDALRRVTGTIPLPNPPSEIASDIFVVIQDDPSCQRLFPPPMIQETNICIPETASAAPDAAKMGRTASVRRVASLEHLQKRICRGANQCGSIYWDTENSCGKNQI